VFVALLRAVNLAGRNAVSMAALRSIAEEAGFQSVKTLLQSGNLVFRAPETSPPELETTLERRLKAGLGLTTDIMVRSGPELHAIVAANPFPDAARDDPGHLVVNFLKQSPPEEAVQALREANKGPEIIHARGRELYIVYPEGIGRSKLTGALMDSKLKTRGTGRNWNTVLKLADMARD
jgi:uncharacterized protein (DUF1697 family)